MEAGLHFRVVVLVMITSAFFESLGIVLISTLIGFLSDPQFELGKIRVINIIEYVYSGGYFSQQEFFTIIVLIFFTISVCVKSLTVYIMTKYVATIGSALSIQSLNKIMQQDYEWLIKKRSGEITKDAISTVDIVVRKSITPLMQLLLNVFMVLAIFLILLISEGPILIAAMLSIFLIYLFIYYLFRVYLSSFGMKLSDSESQKFMALNDMAKGLRDIIVTDSKDYWIDRFKGPAADVAKYNAKGQLVALLPRYILEALVFGGMLVALLFLISDKGGVTSALPTLTLYVFSAYKLIPAVQQIYASIASIKFSATFVERLKKIFNKENSINILKNNHTYDYKGFDSCINFKNINYKRDGRSFGLKDVSLLIEKGSNTAIIGESGSGKSTFLDILSGLIPSDSGDFLVDGILLDHNSRVKWEREVSYASQDVNVFDGTVSENIAFGVSKGGIDMDRVIKVSKIACIHDFIDKEMPDKYDTNLGDSGVFISGGQRQRVGIARSLFRNPKLLILDEATSALDELTERTILDNLNSINNLTIIRVIHGKSTLKYSDKVYQIKDGYLSKIDKII